MWYYMVAVALYEPYQGLKEIQEIDNTGGVQHN